MDNWYVLHVLTGNELDVKKSAEKMYKAIVPRRLLNERKFGVWETVERVLMPGYVFVQTEMQATDYYELTSIPGVINILEGASGCPEPIREDEMKTIFSLTRDGDLVGISDIFQEGQDIKVINGPLQGFEGNIIKVDRRRFRAKVKFTVAGNEKVIELAVNVLNKA